MLRKYVDEVFKKIVTQNQQESTDSIPHSDVLAKFVESNMGIDADSFKTIIAILKESHKILSLQVTKENKNNNIDSVDGFIDADITTIRRLKGVFQRVLSDMYEEEYHKRIPQHMIVRELFPIMNRINRTPLGNIANKAIMLDEFEKLLQKEYTEYTEDLKAKMLDRLLSEHEKVFDEKIKRKKLKNEKEAAKKTGENRSKRAVDNPELGPYTKTSLNKVIQIYGVEFFFRINMRKYNFDYIAEIIDSRQINKRSDLKLLKKMIQTVKNNTDKDPKLAEYMDRINKLERIVSRYINIG